MFSCMADVIIEEVEGMREDLAKLKRLIKKEEKAARTAQLPRPVKPKELQHD